MSKHIQKISKYAPSIFQGRLNFATASGRGFSFTTEHSYERTFLRVVLGVLAALAALYIYFVCASVLNVIARKDAMAQTARLASSISELERNYFAASQGVRPEEGAKLGLSPVSNTEYVYRPGNLSADRQAPASALGRMSGNEI